MGSNTEVLGPIFCFLNKRLNINYVSEIIDKHTDFLFIFLFSF